MNATTVARLLASLIGGLLPGTLGLAQTFTGTNAPGGATNFTFSISAAATNLALTLPGSATAYSSLMIRRGMPPTDTAYDFSSQVMGTNAVYLELPEAAPGTYYCRVRTPVASAAHAFTLTVETNLSDLRTAQKPVTRLLTNSAPVFGVATVSSRHYFRIELATNLGWQIRLETTNSTQPHVYVRNGQIPSESAFTKASTGATNDSIAVLPKDTMTGPAYIGVFASGLILPQTYKLVIEPLNVRTLAWDPGLTHEGTMGFTNDNGLGGDYYFRITTDNPSLQAWRTALKVTAGEADVYLTKDDLPSPSNVPTDQRSERMGSDGFVLPASKFSYNQEWFILVKAVEGAQWTLVSGTPYVTPNLPIVAPDDPSGGGEFEVGPEGIRYFSSTVPADSLAWRFWLNGSNNVIYLRQNRVPLDRPAEYELSQPGQMLVVPPYLVGGAQYFVGIPGPPHSRIRVDSRQQRLESLAYDSTVTANVTGYGYITYKIDVPSNSITWQITLSSTNGNPNLAVRRGFVPNESNNDAFSDLGAGNTDQVTLVPPPQTGLPGLSGGSFYLTVYGSNAFHFKLENNPAVVTDIRYVDVVTNDQPTRVGWRFFRVGDILEQQSSLGWDLLLTNFTPGTRIALRRTKAPGIWSDRSHAPPQLPVTTARTYYDYLSAADFLQRPGHEAEVWYVGVYNPSNALGNFTLITRQLQTASIADNTPVVRTNVPAGRWDFYSISVPTNLVSSGGEILGWDVRLINVTYGLPKLVIRRDGVPTNNVRSTLSVVPPFDTNWPSLQQWAASADWTRRAQSSIGTNEDGRILAMGVGRPLEPGTYFIGVLDNQGAATNRMTYTLVSRWIGTNQAIRLRDLPWNGGAITNTVTPREADYYRMVVPPGVASWKARLRLLTGEAMLVVMSNAVPNVISEKRVQKIGTEQYLRLPRAGDVLLSPGTNYLVVIGEGQSPPDGNRVGTGASTYVIESLGSLPIIELGQVGPADLVYTTNLLEGGASHAFHFQSPTARGFWLTLEAHSGLPTMVGLLGTTLPDPGYSSDTYGNEGGVAAGAKGPTFLITGLAPIPDYSVTIKARGTGGGATADYLDASYTLRVKEIVPSLAAFDGSTNTVSGADGVLGQFFYIDVPSDALGWDLRLVNVSSGSPSLYIRRGDWLPHDSIASMVLSGTTWLVGDQYKVLSDWTGRPYGPSGELESGRVFTVGMGRPLQPGRYCVGVFGAGTLSYSLVSRGIGQGYSIPVQPLAFNGGMLATNLPAREAAFYRVTVPTNTTSWKLRLGATVGESCLAILKDALPNITATESAFTTFGTSPGRRVQKSGDEQFLLLPNPGQDYLPAGTYYLAVISEGANASISTRVGSDPSQMALTSAGQVIPFDLGIIGETETTDHRSLDGGEVQLYRFTVPNGSLNLDARIEGFEGVPVMALVGGGRPPNPSVSLVGVSEIPLGYGTEGGESVGIYASASLLNVANPVTNFLLAVKARGSAMVFSNATYTLHLNTSRAKPIAFDGGAYDVTNQPSGTMEYFRIVVPTNVLGWDLRLINVSTGLPRMVVCREALPSTLATTIFTPATAVTWPTNAQWAPGADWSTRTRAADGTDETGRLLAMGMGSPLEPGTYYVGIKNLIGTAPMSYTLLSRGIGPGQTIPVVDLPTLGVVTNVALAPREASYYRVVVPSNAPSWKLRLAPTGGESLMVIRNGSLPNIENNSALLSIGAGKKMQKAGNEHFVFLPSSGLTNLPPGTNFVAVVSEGVNPSAGSPSGGTIGVGISGYVLTSGFLDVTPLGLLTSEDLVRTNDELEGGETRAYQFEVPMGTIGMKLWLEGREANPVMIARQGRLLPKADVAVPGSAVDYYGNEGGLLGGEAQTNLLTIPNPVPGTYSALVKARGSSPITFDAANARYTLRVQEILVPQINFGSSENTNGLNHAVSGQLQDNERAFFKILVPEIFEGHPVIGWKLSLVATNGTAVMRVRPNALPSDADATILMSFATNTAVIAPPFLTNGTWYVEVKAIGSPGFTLVSSPLTLERPQWVMPGPGDSNVAAGLVWPMFADTGVDTNGMALLGSQGLFLPHGNLHYYAIEVPSNNIGLLRAELKAISGNPDLYVRAGGVPTLSHRTNGAAGTIYDREMSTPGVTEYANWVPLDGKTEVRLAPGLWYLAVLAAGSVNAEYRLSLSAGYVTDLALHGPGVVALSSAVEDWRYFRVMVPPTVPFDFNITFSQLQGGVAVYVRDTVPPGNGRSGVSSEIRDWQTDGKNGPSSSYPRYTTVGTYLLAVPPLRSWHIYYIGVRATSGNPTFDLRVTTNGTVGVEPQVIAFDGGYVDTFLPPSGQALYRIDVPANATRWKHAATHMVGVKLFIEQGAAPLPNTSADWYSTIANHGLDRLLVGAWNPIRDDYDVNAWPWVPGQSYYLLVTNTTEATERFVFNMTGKDVNTDDNDTDGLPDIWEYRYFGNTISQRGTNDFDGDAVSNLDELSDGTDPTNARAFWARLVVGVALGRGSVRVEPDLSRYPLGSAVVVIPVPDSDWSFVGWAGHTNGLITPLLITMTGHVTNYAMFKLAGDDFATALTLSGLNTTVFGTNVGMSKEPGEPMHAGNPGGKSIWWRWTAPASVLVDLSTAGSSFNTLLAVYTGMTVSNLTWVASDNNSLGGTSRSHVQFAADAGTTYSIAVDGYNGASSRITLALTTGDAACAPCRFERGELQPDGRIRWSLTGSPGCTYQLSWSSNLVSWTVIGPVAIGADGTQWFMDPDPMTYPTRFYRGQSQ